MARIYARLPWPLTESFAMLHWFVDALSLLNSV